ncbi:MAG: hypothetical protein JXA42_17485 [Anaerolineales bacterium]|nr:hypothetical protein [Anaerolineales bacterium]
MEIPLNVKVFCSDGLCGQSKEVIMNRKTERMTYLVVKENQTPHIQRLVPVEEITNTTPTTIQLCCSKKDVARMDPFIKTDVFREEFPQYTLDPYLMEIAYPESRWVTVSREAVPVGEVAVKQGAHIQATDGRVGQLDEFMVDPKTEQVTHLVMREGHLWGKKEVTVPVSEIDHLGNNTVYLKLDKRHVETLQSPPAK